MLEGQGGVDKSGERRPLACSRRQLADDNLQ
jgi:hypothetical protein